MKVHRTHTSFLAKLLMLIALGVSCRASKWVLKPGQNLDSTLENYEKVVLDLIDETQLDLYTEETLDASKDGKTLIPIHLEIPAFGRTLFLHLRWGETAFTPDAKIVVHGRTANETMVMNATDLHTGYVEGFLVNDTRSIVRGLVLYGAFLGLVSSMDGNFYVEPASHYFLNASPLDVIVYRDRDVMNFENGPKRFKDNVEGDKFFRDGPNGFSNTFTRVAKDSSKGHRDDLDSSNRFRGSSYRGSKGFRGGSYMGSKRARDGSNSVLNYRKFCTGRTNSQAAKGAPFKKVCRLVVVADHIFYTKKGDKDLKTTVALMEMHVKDTDFSGEGTFDDIHIQMSRVELYRTPHDDNYYMSNGNLSTNEYLVAFSRYTHFENYCAAIAFTYLSSTLPTLGDNFMGEAGDHKRGICAPVCCAGTDKQSKNAAWVTFNDNGTDMPVARAAINLAHQMGHLFGSLDDQNYTDTSCSGVTDPEKVHIMNNDINKGITQENKWFSFCSIKSMRQKIKTEGRCLNLFRCCSDDGYRCDDSFGHHQQCGSGASLMGKGLVGFRILQFWILGVVRHLQLTW